MSLGSYRILVTMSMKKTKSKDACPMKRVPSKGPKKAGQGGYVHGYARKGRRWNYAKYFERVQHYMKKYKLS